MHHRFDRAAVSVLKLLFERARVYADTDRQISLLARVYDGFDVLFGADVARVYADSVDKLANYHGVVVIKVDIGDDGQRAGFYDLAQRGGVLLVKHGAAHDIAAGKIKPLYLL